jgi:hypothetical protein
MKASSGKASCEPAPFFSNVVKLGLVCSFSNALESSPTKDQGETIRFNRTLAFLKTVQFEEALRDLEVLCSQNLRPKNREKTLLYKAQALYGQGKYKDSADIFTVLCFQFGRNAEGKSGSVKARQRLVEQETGKYNFTEMYNEIKAFRSPHLDHASFVGSVVVKTSEGKGRGLFTTQGVKAGDLLLCEKAFAHCPDENNQEAPMGRRGQRELIRLTVQKLHRNPSLLPAIADLHRGTHKSVWVSEVDGRPVIDA